jgi:pimeloyl-ACP methyl ester carboxylesterase
MGRMTNSSHIIDAGGGLRLRAVEVGAGVPLIWSHGLLSSKEVSLQTLGAAHGYRVVAFDQRGHGESCPLSAPEDARLACFASDLLLIADAFEISRGIYCGESMGAATALRYAIDNPNRVKALLIDRPAFGSAGYETGIDWAAEADRLDALGIDRWMEDSLQDLPIGTRARINERYQRHWQTHEPTSIATIFRALPDWHLPEPASLAKLDVPVVVRAWEGDPIHPLALAEELVSTLPEAQLVRIDRRLHYDVDQDASSVAACLNLLARPA